MIITQLTIRTLRFVDLQVFWPVDRLDVFILVHAKLYISRSFSENRTKVYILGDKYITAGAERV